MSQSCYFLKQASIFLSTESELGQETPYPLVGGLQGEKQRRDREGRRRPYIDSSPTNYKVGVRLLSCSIISSVVTVTKRSDLNGFYVIKLSNSTQDGRSYTGWPGEDRQSCPEDQESSGDGPAEQEGM